MACTHPNPSIFQPYQLVTHLFFHDLSNFSHIFGNMFALWMFGMSLENLWGSQRFFIFYVTRWGRPRRLGVNVFEYYSYVNEYSDRKPTRRTARAVHAANSTVGASERSLASFGLWHDLPEQRIYLYLMPIKAKYFVAIYGLFELFAGFANQGSNIAHFAHIGGMVFGYLLLRYWKRNQFRRFKPWARLPTILRSHFMPFAPGCANPMCTVGSLPLWLVLPCKLWLKSWAGPPPYPSKTACSACSLSIP